ncbi:MAG: hypothetical protein OEV59_09300 [Deltaproteobacteria bacterium]|nr:hypothetical protein [Deltaproteobacteria bacterium]
MRITAIKKVSRSLVVFGAAMAAVLLPCSAYAVISGSARLAYDDMSVTSATGTSNITTISEGYMLNVQKRFTNTISATLSSSWTRTTVDDGTATKSNSEVSPIVMFNFTPPSMYTFNMSYTRTDSDPSNMDHVTNTNARASLGTPKTGFVQPVFLLYSHQKNYDHANVRRLNTTTDNFGASTAYNFIVGGYSTNVSYGFTNDLTKDLVSLMETENESHNVSGGLSRVFSKKFRASLNLAYSTTDTTASAEYAPTRFPTVAVLNAGYSCFGAACALPYTTGSLTAQGAPDTIIDNDLITPVDPPGIIETSIDLNNAGWNIGGGFTLPQTVHTVRVYISTGTIEEASIINNTYNFNWSVYSSMDNVVWTPVAGVVTVTYDSISNYFELTFADTDAIYFKAVNGNGQGVSNIDVTEFEVLGYAIASAVTKYSSSRETQSFGFSLGYTPIELLALSYSFGYTESNTKDDFRESGTYSSSNAVMASYVAHPQYLNIGLTVNQSESGTKDKISTQEIWRYSAAFSSNPLDTVNSSLTLSRADTKANGKKSNATDSIALSLGMRLYRGIDLQAGASQTANTLYGTPKGTSGSTTYNAVLFLKPRKSVTVTLTGVVSESETNVGGQKTNSSGEAAKADFSYRPTDIWSLGGTIDITPVSTQTYYLSIMPTRKVNLNASLAFTPDAESKNITINWNPFQRTSLGVRYSNITNNSSDSETDMMSLYVSISI